MSRAFLALLLLASLAGCKREQRVFDPGASGTQVANGVAVNPIHAGGTPPGSQASADYSKYDESAYAVAEGKRLYNAYNCVGCHAHGGGAIGPALMDSTWIYGSHPDQIFSDIAQGPAERDAVFRREDRRLPDMGAGGLRPLHERAASERRRAFPVRRDARCQVRAGPPEGASRRSE